MSDKVGKWVEIEFDCLPLRSVGKLEVPVDASPRYAEFVMRVEAAIEKHGTVSAYFLHRALCKFHLTNHREFGELVFRFEGTVLTDGEDKSVRGVDLDVELASETCDWLNEPVVRWFCDSVHRAVTVEFNRFIEAGDLSKTEARLERMQQQLEDSGGYMGMYL